MPTTPDLDPLLEELLRLAKQIAEHQSAISELAGRRRALAEQVANELGPTETAKRLGISRQTLWQILKPEQSKDIKRRSEKRSGSARAPGS